MGQDELDQDVQDQDDQDQDDYDQEGWGRWQNDLRVKMIRIRMKHLVMLDVFPIVLAGRGGHVIKLFHWSRNCNQMNTQVPRSHG